MQLNRCATDLWHTEQSIYVEPAPQAPQEKDTRFARLQRNFKKFFDEKPRFPPLFGCMQLPAEDLEAIENPSPPIPLQETPINIPKNIEKNRLKPWPLTTLLKEIEQCVKRICKIFMRLFLWIRNHRFSFSSFEQNSQLDLNIIIKIIPKEDPTLEFIKEMKEQFGGVVYNNIMNALKRNSCQEKIFFKHFLENEIPNLSQPRGQEELNYEDQQPTRKFCKAMISHASRFFLEDVPTLQTLQHDYDQWKELRDRLNKKEETYRILQCILTQLQNIERLSQLNWWGCFPWTHCANKNSDMAKIEALLKTQETFIEELKAEGKAIFKKTSDLLNENGTANKIEALLKNLNAKTEKIYDLLNESGAANKIENPLKDLKAETEAIFKKACDLLDKEGTANEIEALLNELNAKTKALVKKASDLVGEKIENERANNIGLVEILP